MKNNFESFNKYITAFAEMMRKSFLYSTKEYVSLNNEITFNENYLKMEQLNHNFDFEFNIDRKINIYNIFIPPLFIQPLLENCIKHGIKRLNGKKCELSCSLLDDISLIEIVITNDIALKSDFDFNKNEGSLELLFARIESLKKLNKNKAISLYYHVENNKVITTIKLPFKTI